MRSGARAVATAVALLAPYTVASASSTSADRIAATGNLTTLTHTAGGGGGSFTWLHNFDADSLLTLGAEHQKLAVAHWSFGTVSGALTRELGNGRYNFSAEAHEGSGQDGVHPLGYHIEAVSVTGTYFHRLSLLLEYRRIDVETTHGNLPKAGLAYLWSPHWLTTVSYQQSAGGNLGTRLTSLRIDRYSPVVNVLLGGSYGQASPTIIALGIVSPGHILREGYLGVSKTFARRTDVSLTGDYINLSGSKQGKLTLGFIVRLGSLGANH